MICDYNIFDYNNNNIINNDTTNYDTIDNTQDPSNKAQAASQLHHFKLSDALSLAISSIPSEKQSTKRETTYHILFKAITHYATGDMGQMLLTKDIFRSIIFPKSTNWIKIRFSFEYTESTKHLTFLTDQPFALPTATRSALWVALSSLALYNFLDLGFLADLEVMDAVRGALDGSDDGAGGSVN